MNPSSQPIAAVMPTAAGLALPAERQLALLMQDDAGFVARGLAILWREHLSGDLAAEYATACGLIEAGNAAALGACLREHPELVEHRCEADGRQLLHHVACHGNPELVRLLVAHGAPVDSPSGRMLPGAGGRFDPGATPLLLACEAGRSQLALALMEAGADVCACLPSGRETPLHFAAALGMEGLADALVASGADVDAMADAKSYDDQLADFSFNAPIHLAALNNRPELVSLLLKSGAKRDLAGPDARSALHYAAARGSVAALEVLLAAGADPDAGECCSMGEAVTRLSPLHYAALNGHQPAVAMLLCYGADARRVEAASGEDAVRMAERSEDPGLVAMLERAAKGEAPEAVFSYLDDQYFSSLPGQYAEMRPFLDHLLSEFPLGQRSLLTLSDWLSEVLGAENRPYLARAYRARQNNP